LKIGLFETIPGFGGGNVYQKYIVRALQPLYDVHVFTAETSQLLGHRLGKVWHSVQLLRAHPEIDLWICTYLPTIALNFVRSRSKAVSLFYHLDDSGKPHSQVSVLLRWLYLRQARRCDGVVVIAQYWRDYLKEKKVRVTDLIYWGFDVARFSFSQEEVQDFKKKYDLLGKPIIYLGNCQRRKGVAEAYEQLKYLDAHLVTSGEEQIQIPARNLRLSYREYCLLLRASNVVLTLSKFKEGWNATAHEAMLVRTPVIGSGLGGMRELLEGGKQIICPDISALPGKVEYAIAHERELGEQGYRFASQFTLERFERSWLELVEQVAV